MWRRVDLVSTDVSEERIANCDPLLTLVPRSRIFLPRRWGRYVLPKRQFTQDLHGATSQRQNSPSYFIKFQYYISDDTNEFPHLPFIVVSAASFYCRIEAQQKQHFLNFITILLLSNRTTDYIMWKIIILPPPPNKESCAKEQSCGKILFL
jgi:hypothetical protein